MLWPQSGPPSLIIRFYMEFWMCCIFRGFSVCWVWGAWVWFRSIFSQQHIFSESLWNKCLELLWLEFCGLFPWAVHSPGVWVLESSLLENHFYSEVQCSSYRYPFFHLTPTILLACSFCFCFLVTLALLWMLARLIEEVVYMSRLPGVMEWGSL